MSANWGIARGTITTPARHGPLWRLARWLKSWIDVEPRLQSRVDADVPEHEHHARFSVAELDACIEHSFHEPHDRETPPSEAQRDAAPAGPSRKAYQGRMPPALQAPAEEARAFGGDLYPTAAHGAGRHVRYVRVKTWLGATGPLRAQAQRPS